MTILSVVQNASPLYIPIEKPLAIFTSIETEHQELAALANRAADYITSSYDWRILTKQYTLVGDGTTTEWNLPADFQKFTDDSRGEPRIITALMTGPMIRINDLSTWLEMDVRQFGRVTYSWILIGGKISVKPALPAGQNAYFYYQSKNVVQPSAPGSTPKSEFNLDTDTFLLDERLLSDCIIWMWRHQKGQPYAEIMADFERRKSYMVMADKGPKSISFGRRSSTMGAEMAYPFGIV